MRIVIDTKTKRLGVDDGSGEASEMDLYSPEAFAILSRQWIRVGWAQRYSYQFTWMGRPIIQLPEDMVRTQEAIWRTRPDVIIETGVAHGGSLVFYASLCELLGNGHVIGVDIEIRPHNRAAIEAHPLASRISLVEGSSTDARTLEQVTAQIRPGSRVMVLLDSNHTKAHVRAELEAYAPLVSKDCYIVATDGIMHDLHDVPGGTADWAWNHAVAAAADFAAEHPEFVIEPLPRSFSETAIDQPVTYWPGAWLRRR